MYPSQDILEKISLLLQKNASREAFLKFQVYLNLLFEENEKYNLIGKNEKPFIWERHVLDSLQLYPFLKSYKKIIDLGSGAGFPGIPLSIIGIENITLLDSNEKKCEFLKIASREAILSTKILCGRVENIKNKHFHMGISRAMASLSKILEWTEHLCPELLIMKGKSYAVEVAEAQKDFLFDYEIFPSLTNPESRIIKIKNFKKKLE